MPSNICTVCNKTIRKIKNDPHAAYRTVHKKCYREKKNGETASALGAPVSALPVRSSPFSISIKTTPEYTTRLISKLIKKEEEDDDDNCETCHRDILRCKCNSINWCFYQESM